MSSCKRRILGATSSLLLRVVVHPAIIQDRYGGRLVLARLGERFPDWRTRGRIRLVRVRSPSG